MKKFLPICAALLLVIGVVSTANASPLGFDDLTEFGENGTTPSGDLDSYGGEKVNMLEGPWDFIRWTHHFEFNPPAQEVLSGNLTVYLRDDTDPWWQPFEFALGWAEDWTFAFGEVDTGEYSYSVTASYLEDGAFTVTIASLLGDFYIDQSVLSGTYSAVPIPTSILLLASGLAGFFGIRKKRLLVFKK